MPIVFDSFMEPVWADVKHPALAHLRSSMVKALMKNEAVGVIAGFYDDKLTICCASNFLIELLGYGTDSTTFFRACRSSLTELICGTDDFPFEPENFGRQASEKHFVFLRADSTPILMRTVRVETKDDNGRAMWVLSVQGSRDSQMLEILGGLILFGYWSVDFDMTGKAQAVRWSDSFRRMLGYRTTDAFPERLQAWLSCVACDEEGVIIGRFREALLNVRQETFEIEWQLRRHSGDKRWYRSNCRILRRRDGRPYRMAGAVVDITDQRLAQQVKLKQEAFYRALSKNILCQFLVNLESNTFEVIETRDETRGNFDPSLSWEKQLADYVQRFVDPADRAQVLDAFSIENLKAVLLTQNRFSLSLRHAFADGFLWCEHVYLCSERFLDGRPKTVTVYVQDVTDEKQRADNDARLLSESSLRDELLAGLNKLVSWYIVYEPEDDRYSFYQERRAGESFVYPPDGRFSELMIEMGRHLRPMYFEGSIGEALDVSVLRRKIHSSGDTYRIQLMSVDDVTGYTDVSVIAMTGDGGQIRRYLIVGQDNSARIHNELKVRQSLQLACDVAKTASEAKTKFLSIMSHDIRTPMNAIMGMSAIAEMNADNAERVRYCLERITQSSQYLLALINEVLDLSRIESGSMKLASGVFSLREVVAAVQAIVKPAAKLRRHDMVWMTDGIVHDRVLGDALHLQQILVNLVSNAVKYTPDGGRIEVSVVEDESAESSCHRYRLSVKDNGIGMSQAFLARLFDPFSREERDFVRSQQGTGLGMSITKNMVLLMGGTITVESEINKGSTFVVTLRLAKSTASEAGQAAAGESMTLEEFCRADYAGHRVLLVEDNEINREIAEEILKSVGIVVETAIDGAEAVEKVRGKPGVYDLVLMDIQMPVMNGYEATRAIRALGRTDTNRLPILAMTADVFAEDITTAEEAGMNGHLGKPVNLAKLSCELKKWLK